MLTAITLYAGGTLALFSWFLVTGGFAPKQRVVGARVVLFWPFAVLVMIVCHWINWKRVRN